MDLLKKANLIIYRFREKGLEVFLVNSAEEGENWEIPQGEFNGQRSESLRNEDRLIELDPVKQESGDTEEAWAVEGDWHEIPSLKGMLYEDARQVKDALGEMDSGTFFVLKEAFKKVMPHQYAFLKELKDILIDRNSIRDL
ncbi:MAG: hypothetical protein KDD06_21535 [Phaeodactylibacter sp.]|nr:hypothetical protein [Phaeodactylibacter sp.]MCB9287211.1 hypothetical protein [Lewinellaceae bacterium]